MSQWPSVAGVTVRLAVDSPAGDHAEVECKFPSANGGNAGAASPDGATETPLMAASPATWTAILEGEANVITEITSGRLRCFNPNDTHRIRSDEVPAIGALLGLATVPADHTADHEV